MDAEGTVYTVDGLNRLFLYRSATDTLPALDPIPSFRRTPALDLYRPTDAEVLWVAHISAPSAQNVTVLVEEVGVATLDPPRFFPKEGPARMIHLEYRCSVDYTTAANVHEQQIVFIDADYLRRHSGFTDG